MSFDTDTPFPLLDQTARFCMANTTTTLSTFGSTQLRPGLVLPGDVCEKLFQVADKELESFDEGVVPIFEDTSRTRLKTLGLRNSSISAASFQTLMKHNPFELDIRNCNGLGSSSLDVINTNGGELLSLIIGNSAQLLPETYSMEEEIPATITPVIHAPKLRRLVIWNLHIHDPIYWRNLVPNFDILTHLDLSNCMEIEELEFLRDAKNLVYLCLHNVTLKAEGFEVLRGLGKVRHLDISQSSENSSMFRNPNELLSSLVTSMLYLTSLDISGTNLAGRGVAHTQIDSNCDILGLNSRVGRPLEFLGLYSTHHDASHRHHIPAKNIAGDKDEGQILTACQAYLDRHEVLEKVLNDLFHLFRAEKCLNVTLSLNLILAAMSRHLGEKHVQISCSASLVYAVKYYEAKNIIGILLRRQILSTLIESMEMHKSDSLVMMNGCLTICLFKIPEDVMFKYKKLVKLLLDILTTSGAHAAQDDFVQRTAMCLLNPLAYQVEGGHKQLLGDLGAIQKMLLLIQDRLDRNECDDVLEMAWSIIWNVTNESADNCEKFVRWNGIALFLHCWHTFPYKPYLVRMTGVLGNVAEVPDLRRQLMTRAFVHVFCTVLDSTQDNIDVSYNAAGVLAHILSDGIEAWRIDLATRDAVLENMQRKIARWDINAQRNINYRSSFEPILRLLTISHTSVCQLWAAWALANLTRVYPHKYCPLLENEGGLGLLIRLAPGESIVSQYAALSIDHVRQFKETGIVVMVPIQPWIVDEKM